jgi:hypothetical protein
MGIYFGKRMKLLSGAGMETLLHEMFEMLKQVQQDGEFKVKCCETSSAGRWVRTIKNFVLGRSSCTVPVILNLFRNLILDVMLTVSITSSAVQEG